MRALPVTLALLATLLAGCPIITVSGRGPNDAAPWNDPCRTQNGPRNDGSKDYGCWGTNTAPYNGPEYHYAWVEGTALRIKFRAPTFQTRRVLEDGGGWDTVDITTWNKTIKSDPTGYGSGQGSYLQEDRGHVLEYFLVTQSGWRNGEKFRISLSQSSVHGYIDTSDVIAGPGVRQYDSERFVIDSTKTY